jgi:hypothetical protein
VHKTCHWTWFPFLYLFRVINGFRFMFCMGICSVCMWKIVLKMNLEGAVWAWTGLIWFRIGIGGGHLETRCWTFVFHTMCGICSLPEKELASQILTSMEYLCMYVCMCVRMYVWSLLIQLSCVPSSGNRVWFVTKHKENQFLTMCSVLTFVTVDCV